MRSRAVCCFFFFNDTATTEIYTLSLHDALPICLRRLEHLFHPGGAGPAGGVEVGVDDLPIVGERLPRRPPHRRSEEHTSELQSQSNLVCRLLLEKKKN